MKDKAKRSRFCSAHPISEGLKKQNYFLAFFGSGTCGAAACF
jgi:hypothetical protein